MPGKPTEARDPLVFKNCLLLPVYHGFLEFAVAVRSELAAFEPEAIAVELPPSLESAVRKAVARLPYLSVVVTSSEDAARVYFPVEPQDALVEAVRFGEERRIPLHFIDLDVHDYPDYREPLPDPFAAGAVGLRPLAMAYLETAGKTARPDDGPDAAREQTMAANILAVSDGGRKRVAAVMGLAHLPGVIGYLEHPVSPPLSRRPRDQVWLANLHPDSSREIMSDIPFMAMAYEVARGSRLPQPAGTGTGKGKGKVVAFEHRVARRRAERGEGDGNGTGKEEAPAGPGPESAVDEAEEAGHGRTARAPEVDPRQKEYTLDRRHLQLELVKQAVRRHKERNGEEIPLSRIAGLFKFLRNWAFLEGGLLPDFYQLCIGARSMADDDFAWEVWDLGSDYPWQDDSQCLPTVRITAEDLLRGKRKIRFRRKIKNLRRRLVPIRKRRRERFPGEWKKDWKGFSICSYPPEDIIIEGFGDYLRKKAIKMLAEEQSRVEPFTTSLLDGIDLRETIRNWHEKKIYVRSNRHIHGKAGSLVIIFDADARPPEADPLTWEEQFPYRMTWHGEHSQESDLACYASEPGETLVGPGISRCLYGGLMMTYPPRRVFDIWRDPFFSWIESKPDRLLAAAIDYCLEKFIVFIAAKPPKSWLKILAERMGKKVIYIPIGQLSPVTLKKIRTFHILDGYHVRQIAKDYIW